MRPCDSSRRRAPQSAHLAALHLRWPEGWQDGGPGCIVSSVRSPFLPMPLLPSIRYRAILAAIALVAACGGNPAAPDVPPVVAITAAGGVSTLASGASAQLSATYTDNRGKLASNAVFVWASSNTAVATVTASGLVTVAQAGTTTG
jgi:hypothetical protein